MKGLLGDKDEPARRLQHRETHSSRRPVLDDKARPALGSKVAKVKAKTKMKKTNGDQSAVARPALADACTDVATVQEDTVEMTGAEARAPYMLALAARAFSDEQMRVLAAANVVDDDGYAEREQASAELGSPAVEGCQ